MLYKFLCSAAVLAALVAPALAQSPSAALLPGANAAGDSVIVEMNKAFKRGDKSRLTQLLPQARGHALEPWAAYWELKARLGEASPQEVQDFLARYAGSYQEDRLRNDWLLLLGQRRDWTSFAAEHPSYRMNDDREVRCYALLVEHLKNPTIDARLSDEVRKNWYAQSGTDDGCTAAAERLVGSKNLTPLDVWQKARLALEANRPNSASNAVTIVAPEALGMVAELNSSPIRFLSGKYSSVLMPAARSSAASLVESRRVVSSNTATKTCTTVPTMSGGYRFRMSIRSMRRSMPSDVPVVGRLSLRNSPTSSS
jgi:soluble lytic murein transglycosylase